MKFKLTHYRPYGRFLCPYGVLLGWMSKFSKWHLDIAPKGACVDCRLCEDSCPYNAIDMPTPPSMVDEPAVGVSRVRRFVFAAPIIILLGALTGVLAHEGLARMNSTIRLSERVAAEDLGLVAGYTDPLRTSTKSTEQLQMESFRASEQTTEQLHAEATVIRASFKTGSAWFGAFMGLMISLKLIGLSIARKRTVYEPNREACYSCGRCFPYCPVEEPEGAQP